MSWPVIFFRGARFRLPLGDGQDAGREKPTLYFFLLPHPSPLQKGEGILKLPAASGVTNDGALYPYALVHVFMKVTFSTLLGPFWR